jgi:hypothetical protein
VNRCQPVRSLRAKRGRFVMACLLLTAAALMMFVNADWRDRAISPGPLARQHAQLLERGDTAPNCAACHAAANAGLLSWSASLVVGHGDAPSQSQRCLACHETTINADLALAAHNLPVDQLAAIASKPGTKPRELVCAACHQEHQGGDHDLVALDNDSCQACHQQRYNNFADEHPDFAVWPYERRTRIVFDHAAHESKHFAKTDRPFNCRACHLDDATGNAQLLAGYDAACASCHDERIRTSVAGGVPMLALPTLDVDALREASIDVGPWPAMATGDFDGRLPPMMKLLLAADPAAAKAIDTLGADFEFFDVDPDDAEHLRAASDLATAIKQLFNELNESGHAVVRERLRKTLGREVAAKEIEALVAGLSVDTLRPAIAAWLPDVEAGKGDWTSGEGPVVGGQRSDAGTQIVNAAIAYDPAGTWSRDDATFTIRYQPTSHADPVLTAWLSLVVSAADADSEPTIAAMMKELTRATAPGLCVSCHSVERTSVGQLVINWQAYDRTTRPRTFTKFSHGPHLLLPQLTDCRSCHAVDAAANTAASYADQNPYTFANGFLPISKRTCVTCHTPTAAGDRCQSCHNYHVETVEGSGFSNQLSGQTTSALNPEP